MADRRGRQVELPLTELDAEDPDAVGYLERSLASSPVWQMGPKAPEPTVARRDPRLLDFLASARNAPLGELEFDVLTWTVTRWYQAGRPRDGRLSATFGDIAHALYGRRQGGRQYRSIREALDNLYNVSLDLSVLTLENGSERWVTERRRRVIQDLSLGERVDPGAEAAGNRVNLQLGSWLVDQLDAHTVAAIAWQVIRRLTGISKRLAIYLAAHSGDFEPITRHTERFTVELTEDLYQEFGITATRERDKRASVARATKRIAAHDPRYSKVVVERAGASYRLRAERPIGVDLLALPTSQSAHEV